MKINSSKSENKYELIDQSFFDFPLDPINSVIDEAVEPKRTVPSCYCLNAHPVSIRPSGWKNPPGILGDAYRLSQSQSLANHSYFVLNRNLAGRKRDFKPIRKELLDACLTEILSRTDFLTSICMLNYTELARNLSKRVEINEKTGKENIIEAEVTVCRISRLIKEVLKPFDLVRSLSSTGVETTFKGKPVFDELHGIWYPEYLVVQPTLYEMTGVDMDDYYQQMREKQDEAGINKKQPDGSILDMATLRRQKCDELFLRAFNRRKEYAAIGKLTLKLQDMGYDDAKNFMSKRLLNRYIEEKGRDYIDVFLEPSRFENEVKNLLARHGLYPSGSPPRQRMPHTH